MSLGIQRVFGKSLVKLAVAQTDLFIRWVHMFDGARELMDEYFLFLHKKIYCGYSLQAPLRGASNEYPQYMFFIEKARRF